MARLHRHGAVTRQEVLALLADAGFDVQVDQAVFGNAHVTQATWSGGEQRKNGGTFFTGKATP